MNVVIANSSRDVTQKKFSTTFNVGTYTSKTRTEETI